MNKAYYIVILLLVATVAQAQKFGYVDTDYVLSKMPEFKKAQEELGKLSSGWENEIQELAQDIDCLLYTSDAADD